MPLSSDGERLGRGEGREQARLLERPTQPALGPLVRGEVLDVLAGQDDAPAVHLQEAGDAVEQRRLAGAVLPDEPDDLTLAEVERHLVDGPDPAEALHDVADLEDHRRLLAGRHACRCLGHGCGAVLRAVRRRLQTTAALGLGRRHGGGGAADEHGPEQLRALEQLGGGPGEPELPLLHEDGPVGELQRDVDRLLDDDDRHPGLVRLVHDLDELADDRGREAEGELVDEEERGVGHQCLADGEHLLLAA